MSRISISYQLAALAFLIGFGSQSQAAMYAFPSAAGFASTTIATGTETFQGLSFEPMPSPLLGNVGGYGYTALATGARGSPTGDGFIGAGSYADRWLSTQSVGQSITFTNFTGGVRAAGGYFFGTDSNGAFAAGNTITVTAIDSQYETLQVVLSNATENSFAGFVSTFPLTWLTISINSNTNWVAANDLVLGRGTLVAAPVPEPGTSALLAFGLGFLAVLTHRRSTARASGGRRVLSAQASRNSSPADATEASSKRDR